MCETNAVLTKWSEKVEQESSALRKSHLVSKDDRAAEPAALRVLDGISWKCLIPPAVAVRTSGAGGVDGTLILQALILRPLQRGRWRTFSSHPLMVPFQKGGLLSVNRGGFPATGAGSQTLSSSMRRHTATRSTFTPSSWLFTLKVPLLPGFLSLRGAIWRDILCMQFLVQYHKWKEIIPA
jgi:hypothetical protein